MGINVVSVFDGIRSGMLALDLAKIEVDNYYSSEIKPYAIKVADENYPEWTNHKLGDITKIDWSKLPRIDLLIGGSPCQNFSQANRERLGDKGVKSKLFYEYVRALKELKPKYFLLENVRMKKEHEEIINNILGVEPIMIDSQLVSGALRKRLYWTNIPNTTQPKDRNIKLQDILTSGYTDRIKARCLLESDSRPLKTPVKMFHRYQKFLTLVFKDKQHYQACKTHYNENFKGKSAKYIDDFVNKGGDVSVYDGIRHLNRVERERLQCVPEGYTSSLTENESACVLGDGWTIDIIAHILKNVGVNDETK